MHVIMTLNYIIMNWNNSDGPKELSLLANRNETRNHWLNNTEIKSYLQFDKM